MPKRTSELNKAQRMILVRRAIARNDEATVRHILEYLEMYVQAAGGSPKTHGAAKTLRRRIYEDVRDLIQINEIEEHELEGGSIEEETGRKRSSYTLFGERYSAITGIGYLRAGSCDLFTPSERKIPWEVSVSGSFEPSKEHIKIVFPLFSNTIVLRMFKEDLPVKLVIGRSFDKQNFKFPTKEFVSDYGIRASYLGLPFGELTVKGTKGCVGHAVLDFAKDGKVSVSDLGTVNQTEAASSVRQGEIAQMYGVLFAQLPVSYKLSWWGEIADGLAMKRVREDKKVALPLFLYLGQKHSFLVFDSPKPQPDEIKKAIKGWNPRKTSQDVSQPDVSSLFLDEKGSRSDVK